MAVWLNDSGLHADGLLNFSASGYFTLNFPSFVTCAPGFCSDFALWLSYGVQCAAALSQLVHIVLYASTSVLHGQQSSLVAVLQFVLMVENPQLLYVFLPTFENNCVAGWMVLVYLPSLAAFLMQTIVFDIMMALMSADDNPLSSLRRRNSGACRYISYLLYVMLASLVIPGLGIAIEYFRDLVPALNMTPSVLRTLRAVLMSVILTYTILTTTIMFIVITYYLCCNQRRMRKYMAIRSAVILIRQNLLSVCLIICLLGTVSNIALIVRPFYCDYDLTRFARSTLGIAIALAFVCSPQTRHSLAASCYRCCDRTDSEDMADAEEDLRMDDDEKPAPIERDNSENHVTAT